MAARLAERPAVLYCSATLRPLHYKLKKRKLGNTLFYFVHNDYSIVRA